MTRIPLITDAVLIQKDHDKTPNRMLDPSPTIFFEMFDYFPFPRTQLPKDVTPVLFVEGLGTHNWVHLP